MASPAETGLAVLDLLRAGRFAEIRDRFAPRLQALVSPDVLRAAWDGELGRCGPLVSAGDPVSEPARAGMVEVRIPFHCEHGDLVLVIPVDEAGQLLGLQLAPGAAAEPAAPWQPPDYADPDAFGEEEVRLGSGRLAVPGTLSLPRRAGRLPGVVLLAGSGSLDRDETIGRNKPLKDLAWGLASAGVAVLRFDKVTYAHGAELKAPTDFTLSEEYLNDALAAVELLHRLEPAVDARRIFVLGHSLGGTVAPRVAAIEPAVAGLVIMTGGAEPLHWSIVRQVRYLASLDPAAAAAAESTIAVLTAQAERVDSPDLSPSTPAAELPMGVPASYWLDLRSYDPVAVAARLQRPMLFLQGGRDYQSTVADDLARWEAGLAGRPDVTIRVYPARNHLFTSGSGPSTPAEYEPAQHVDQAVVADIAAWLAAR